MDTNYELSLCFLFIILIIIYFYIKTQPVIEGLKKKKKPQDPMAKLLKKSMSGLTKGIKKMFKPITKLLTSITKMFKPITDSIKQMKDFFKCLGKYNADWIKLIKNSIDCGIGYLNPLCYHFHLLKIIGGILYGFGFLVALVFGKKKSYDQFIVSMQKNLWSMLSSSVQSSYNKCYKCKSMKIPEFCGKKSAAKKSKTIKNFINKYIEPKDEASKITYVLSIIPLLFGFYFLFYTNQHLGSNVKEEN
jgi:hypothetical protein